MKDSIHKYFQVGTIQPVSYGSLPVLEGIHKIACDDYFDAIELGTMQPDLRPQARRLIEQSHLTVCYGAQSRILAPKLNPNALEETERRKAEDTLLEAIDEAEELGAKSVAFISGKWNPETKAEQYAQLLKTTRALCAYAQTKGIRVELEVFDYDMDKAVLIGPAPYAAQFAADVRCYHANFGLMVDLSHFPTTYETSRFVIQTLRPYITHFHIGNAVVKPDCEAYGDMHPRFGFPNSAHDTPQLLEFFTVLKQEGFLGAKDPYVLSLEVKPWGDEDPHVILANTKRVINRAWALLED